MPTNSPEAPPARDADACRALIRSGSRSFFAASLVLPREVRTSARGLYAFCRLADDAIDAPDAGPEALAGLRARLDRIYDGRPAAIAADRAFAQVVHAHAIPRALPEALLEGFAWDAAGRGYETIGELRAYAARVAGTVGTMMATVMGVRDPDALARACDLGVAMQLTNIARDVGEDARAGRLYLPRTWMREAGVDPDGFLADPRHSAALGTVVRRLLDDAADLYRSADAGIAALPARCRPGIAAASRIYADIGREIAHADHDSVSRRAVVPTARKVALLGGALARAAGVQGDGAGAARPALPETHFLVEAVEVASRGFVPARPTGGATQVDFVLDLFMRLQQRDALDRSASAP